MNALFRSIEQRLSRPTFGAPFLRAASAQPCVDLMKPRFPIGMSLQVDARLMHGVLFGFCYGGSLTLRSTEQVGTDVSFDLPLVPSEGNLHDDSSLTETNSLRR